VKFQVPLCFACHPSPLRRLFEVIYNRETKL